MKRVITVSQSGFKNLVKEKLRAAGVEESPAAAAAEEISELTWDLITHNIQVTKQHTELFIYRVETMRELQRQFFAGKRSVQQKAMKAETAVDSAIQKLTGELGYSLQELKNKYEQKSMF